MQEGVLTALIDENGRADAGAVLVGGQRLDQFHAVPGLPRLRIVAQVGAQNLLAPGHLRGGHDGGEGRDAAIALGIAQGHDQRAMPAHRMAKDAAHVAGREVGFHEGRQLVHHVVVHPVVVGPRRLGGVHVEAGPLAQIVAFVIGHVLAARAGVGGHQDEAVPGGMLLGTGLGDEVLFGAGQARKPVEHGAFLARQRLRRQVDAHVHERAGGGGGVLPDFLAAAEAGVLFDLFHRFVSVGPAEGMARALAEGTTPG